MTKIGIFGVCAAFLALMLKKEKSEYSIVVAVAAGMVIFSYGLAQLSEIRDFIGRITERLPLDKAYIRILFKMLGIAYIGELTGNICRDSGYTSIASQLELLAKISIVFLSIPCLSYLMDVVEDFL